VTLKQWLVAGFIVAGAAAAGWAVVGSDSIYQNTIVDKRAAVGAKGRLVSTDNKPLADREAWIFVHGLQFEHQDEHGISIAAARALFAGCTTTFPVLYKEVRMDEELNDRVKMYFFTYDSTRDVSDIGADLHVLIEGNSELTRANTRIVCLSHSKGGNVVQAYQFHSQGRKLVRSVTLDTPHRGSQLADKQAVTKAFKKLYPTVGGKLANLAESRIDFETPGMKWLCPDNSELIKLHHSSPLDERWILYGGVIEPRKGNIWTLVELVDALLLKSDSAEVSAHWSPTGAALIEACGDMSGSDGLISRDSAWAVGLTNGAQTRLMADYNHHEILHSKGGELNLYRQILWDLVTFSPLNNPEPYFGSLDFQLPNLELFQLPKSKRVDFSTSNRVWIDNGQVVVSADEITNGNLIPNSKRLDLGNGVFSWPMWHQGNILTTRDLDGTFDIILVRIDGEVLQLTTDGQSRFASPNDDGTLIAYISGGRLLVRSPGGLARIVIDEQLNIDTPPVIWGNKIYFAHKLSGGEYDIYWVSINAQCYRLDQAKQVAKSTCNPTRLQSPWGNLLITTRILGDDIELAVLLDDKWGISKKMFNGVLVDLNQHLDDLGFSTDCQLAMDSTNGYLYLVYGGEIRQLDTVQLVVNIQDWIQQATTSRAIVVESIDDILPVIGFGTQLDVK